MEQTTVKEKFCNHCKTKKTIDDFYNNRTNPDGRSAHCKTCCNGYTRNAQIRRGYIKGISKKWTLAEENYLRENYNTADLKEMAKYFNKTGIDALGRPFRRCTARMIVNKASLMGIRGARRERYLAECAQGKISKEQSNTQIAKKQRVSDLSKKSKLKLVKTSEVKVVSTTALKTSRKTIPDALHRDHRAHVPKKYESIPLDKKALLPVKIDHKTIIYLPADLSKTQKDKYVQMYSRRKSG